VSGVNSPGAGEVPGRFHAVPEFTIVAGRCTPPAIGGDVGSGARAMAYVPAVKNDIFISYAHVDNERDANDTRWVTEFVRGFMVELRQRLGGPKDLTLFFDESDLHAHHQLQILLENARQSAIFVAVLSPSYISHDWTMKELAEFAGMAGDLRRIIVVEKLPLEATDSYPRVIEHHKRTHFWRTNEPESHTPSTLSAHGRSVEYRSRLENLADQIQRLMREMRAAARSAAPASQDVSVPGGPPPNAPPRTEAARPNGSIPGVNQRTVAIEANAPRPKAPLTEVAEPRGATPDAATPQVRPVLMDVIWPETGLNQSARLVSLAALGGAIGPGSLFASVEFHVSDLAFNWIMFPMTAVIYTALIAAVSRPVAVAMALIASVGYGAWVQRETGFVATGNGPELVLLSGFALGLLSHAVILTTMIEHGWGRGYWSMATAMFCAGVGASACGTVAWLVHNRIYAVGYDPLEMEGVMLAASALSALAGSALMTLGWHLVTKYGRAERLAARQIPG